MGKRKTDNDVCGRRIACRRGRHFRDPAGAFRGRAGALWHRHPACLHSQAGSPRRQTPESAAANSTRRRRAMTIFEAALIAAALAIVLFLVAGGVGTIRQQAKRNLCTRLMTQLGDALVKYHQATGTYPPGAPDSSAGNAVQAMLRVEAAAAALKTLPLSLRMGAEPLVGGVDPWGRPLRYLTADVQNEHDRQEVAANGGVPIFESAGRDKDFGDSNPAAATDNVRTSDLK